MVESHIFIFFLLGDHWTTRCPYKDTLQPLQEILDTDKKEPGTEGTPEPEAAKQVKKEVWEGGGVVKGLEIHERSSLGRAHKKKKTVQFEYQIISFR